MIPEYSKFVRFQDKKLIPFIYLIVFVVMVFYWKNNGYSFASRDAFMMSVILSITLFTLINELKAYWAYSYVLNRVNLDDLKQRAGTPAAAFFARPVVVSVISAIAFWGIAQGCLRLPASRYSIIYFYLVASLFAYLVFRALRGIYIRQLLNTMTSTTKFRSLSQCIRYYLALNTVLSMLSVSPLAANTAFSFDEGYFSAKLMVAMWTLCSIVLALNLAFSRLPKRYVFLGRIFLKEIPIVAPAAVPLARFIKSPLAVRLLIMLMVQAVWIFILSFISGSLNFRVPFIVYFLLSYLPALAYYSLHVYAYWHNEFLMSYDMYFRYECFMNRKP